MDVVSCVYTVRVVQEEDDTPTVTFPDDYPNSVRHFLLIGFLGMFIGAIVFFYMGISRKVNTVMHVLTFFIAAVSACAYYAEWAGLGVEYKTTDTTPRVIFWAHYLDWVITGPVSPRPPCAIAGSGASLVQRCSRVFVWEEKVITKSDARGRDNGELRMKAGIAATRKGRMPSRGNV